MSQGSAGNVIAAVCSFFIPGLGQSWCDAVRYPALSRGAAGGGAFLVIDRPRWMTIRLAAP